MKVYERAGEDYATNQKPSTKRDKPAWMYDLAAWNAACQYMIEQLRSDGWLEIADKAGLCGDVHALAAWLDRECEESQDESK